MQIHAQKAEDFGFRHLSYTFQGDTVDVLIKSKKGEEQKPKPLFFSIQGSRAIPLIIHNGAQRIMYSTMEEDFVEENYHLVIVNKPGVPLIAHKDSLSASKEYFENKDEYLYTQQYHDNNRLDYYVARNAMVIDSLLTKDWVDSSKLILSGHSQGSSIAASLADKHSKVTHLIYSAGMPYFSTILAIISRMRMHEGNEPNPKIETFFNIWEDIVNNPFDNAMKNRDSNPMLYSFSVNENETIKKLNIPVLISYGTKDESAPYHDLFRIECIRDRIDHITFKAHTGLGHNYEMVEAKADDEKTDYLKEVIMEWLAWLDNN